MILVADVFRCFHFRCVLPLLFALAFRCFTFWHLGDFLVLTRVGFGKSRADSTYLLLVRRACGPADQTTWQTSRGWQSKARRASTTESITWTARTLQNDHRLIPTTVLDRAPNPKVVAIFISSGRLGRSKFSPHWRGVPAWWLLFRLVFLSLEDLLRFRFSEFFVFRREPTFKFTPAAFPEVGPSRTPFGEHFLPTDPARVLARFDRRSEAWSASWVPFLLSMWLGGLGDRCSTRWSAFGVLCRELVLSISLWNIRIFLATLNIVSGLQGCEQLRCALNAPWWFEIEWFSNRIVLVLLLVLLAAGFFWLSATVSDQDCYQEIGKLCLFALAEIRHVCSYSVVQFSMPSTKHEN